MDTNQRVKGELEGVGSITLHLDNRKFSLENIVLKGWVGFDQMQLERLPIRNEPPIGTGIAINLTHQFEPVMNAPSMYGEIKRAKLKEDGLTILIKFCSDRK